MNRRGKPKAAARRDCRAAVLVTVPYAISYAAAAAIGAVFTDLGDPESQACRSQPSSAESRVAVVGRLKPHHDQFVTVQPRPRDELGRGGAQIAAQRVGHYELTAASPFSRSSKFMTGDNVTLAFIVMNRGSTIEGIVELSVMSNTKSAVR